MRIRGTYEIECVYADTIAGFQTCMSKASDKSADISRSSSTVARSPGLVYLTGLSWSNLDCVSEQKESTSLKGTSSWYRDSRGMMENGDPNSPHDKEFDRKEWE